MQKTMLRGLGLLMLAGALALGGCKKAVVDVKNADPGTVASKVAAADFKLQPGRWESSMKIESMEMAGMPPEAKAMMDKSLLAERHIATCLTPEQAAKPGANFFNQGKSGCLFEHYTMADGKIDGTMTCNHGPEKMTLTMAGQYSPDSYEVHTKSTATMPGGQAMTSTMTMRSHRAGDCKGDELGAKPKA
jgi:hypothetical protein